MTTITYRQTGDGTITRDGYGYLVEGSLPHTVGSHLIGKARGEARALGSVAARHVETMHGIVYVAEWEREPQPEPDTTFSLNAVVEGLQQRGIPAYVEQTGGGCATIYAGGMHVSEETHLDGSVHRENAWNVSAGPGHFLDSQWTQGVADLGEFYVGANDGSGGEEASLPEHITEARVAVEWAVEAIAASVEATATWTHEKWNRTD